MFRVLLPAGELSCADLTASGEVRRVSQRCDSNRHGLHPDRSFSPHNNVTYSLLMKNAIATAYDGIFTCMQGCVIYRGSELNVSVSTDTYDGRPYKISSRFGV